MADQAKCPVCYPPRWDDPPPEVSLRPDACPARDSHERITRMFALLGRIEALRPVDLHARQQLQSRIDGIRQPHPVFLNGIDLSGYVTNGWGTSDTGQGWTVQSGTAKDFETRGHETLPGLKDVSITVEGTWESDLPTLAGIFTGHFPERDIVIQQPDGRWQAIKARLARRWPLRWLKVRWRIYTTRGVPRLDPETGTITVAASTLTVATITRRGKP